MPIRTPRHTAAALVAVSALLAVSCGGGADRGRPIESLELIDFTVAGMFKQLSAQLGRAYVLELAPEGGGTQSDLRLEDTDERAVLEELCRLEPTFQYRMDTPAWMLFPKGALEESSPFSRRVEAFSADGGVYAVLKQLLGQALPRDTKLSMPAQGKARPVRLTVVGATVRELLAEIAAQAHLGMVIEPGFVRVSVVPE